jgi:hypothetical protein
MRKKGENSVKCAGKSAIPPDKNNDFTLVSKVKHSHPAAFAAHRDCSVAHATCHDLPNGHYRLSRRKQIVEEHFDTVSGEEDWGPRYNLMKIRIRSETVPARNAAERSRSARRICG